MRYIFLVYIVLLWSCNSKQKNGDQYRFSSLSISYSDENVFNLSALSDDAVFVKLETGDSCLIQNIDKVFYIDDQIIIGNGNNILFFDKTGGFNYLINRQGTGPEEYIRLSDFDISPDRKKISILDTQKKEILEYDFRGNLQKRYWNMILEATYKREINWIIGISD